MPDVTKTVGTNARDYSTWAAWEAAIDNTTYPSASTVAIGEGYDDSIFDEDLTLNANPSNVITASITIASAERHDGTAGTGARVVKSVSRLNWILSTANKGRDLAWLELNGNHISPAIAGVIALSLFASGMVGRVRRIILHGVRGQHASAEMTLLKLAGANGTCVNNSILYDYENFSTASGSNSTRGINSPVAATFAEIANVVVDNIRSNTTGAATVFGVFGADIANFKCRNTISTLVTNIGGGTAACFEPSSFATATVNHNASSDATASGTGSIDNVVRANEYVSVTEGMEDYGPLTGCQSFEAGADLVITPFEVNLDIKGFDRDAAGSVWTIGARQDASGVLEETIGIVSPETEQIFSRNIVTNVGTIQVVGNYSGALPGVDYRLRPKNTGIWSDWEDAQATIGADFQFNIIDVPKGEYDLEVRNAGSITVTDSVLYVGVGDIFACAGQSNANGHVTNPLDYTHAYFHARYIKLGESSWSEFVPTAGNSLVGEYSPWGPFATEWMAEHNCPVGFILTAIHGTSITLWQPGQSHYDNMISLISANNIDSVLAVLWIQGEKDASEGMTREQYYTYESILSNSVEEDIVGSPKLCVSHCAAPVSDDAVQAIRLAKQDGWNDNANSIPGVSFHDLLTGNLSSDSQVQTFAERLTYSLTNKLFDAGNGRGPRFESLTRNEDGTILDLVITKDVINPGANYGSGAWLVEDGTPVTLTSVVRLNSRTIRIVPQTPVSIDVIVSWGLGDNAVGLVRPIDADGLPLETFADEALTEAPISNIAPGTPFARPWG